MLIGGRGLARDVDEAFALRLVVSFVIGGGSVALFTAIAEAQGSRLGGLLLSFPIKVVVSLALITANEGLAFAAQTARAVPAGIAINVVFLAGTALLARRLPPLVAVAAGLALWAAGAAALVFALPAPGLVGGMLLWSAAAVAGVLLLDRVPGVRGNRRAVKRSGSFGIRGLLGRAIGAGAAVAFAVLLARVAGPFVGGLASVFPSGFLTAMIILLYRQGPQFAATTARVMVAGSAAPALFGLAAALALPAVGLPLGLTLALATAAAASAAVAFVLARVDPPAPVP